MHWVSSVFISLSFTASALPVFKVVLPPVLAFPTAWKRFHIVVESYVQKKQLSTEYSVVRGRNSTPAHQCAFDIEKSPVLYWKPPGNVSTAQCF
jgi:hypothetical protein